MDIAIIDYGAGNIQSIRFALERLGYHAELTSDAERIRSADRVIFPGVGEAGSAMAKLVQSGLDKVVPELRQPVLGICLGMQLMCRYSEEGDTRGLGIFEVDVKRFPRGLKVPQIGWNSIHHLRGPLFEGIPEATYIYLVHSFYAPVSPDSIARSDYGFEYSAALGRDNFLGVQFHPEKSGADGARMLRNFIEMPT
ncbi:imidazole glycerol phosphate synthase subunit HisH [Robiginitalea sp. SC105]|uniref:imidazole glycerol phosphate synthase subunit HisH n=1 Tax=Robiginitalea sp. SC105 TaxID=2762332 RepID=UPI001639AC65|nr:imidazole glycerol phosphate synthase subunit HisH [Robiginitalea sp. SC105]MBC2840599.1 imidazole glycerol phosphate synthase subunit HisH [Robiginitalea sp. SC105]